MLKTKLAENMTSAYYKLYVFFQAFVLNIMFCLTIWQFKSICGFSRVWKEIMRKVK